MTSGFSNSAVEKVAKELEAVCVLSSRNLQQTLSSLPSSIHILLVEEVLDDDDNDDIDDNRKQKEQEGEDEETEVKDNEDNVGAEEDDKVKYEEDEEDVDEDGPLFALYCGGETSVIAGLGQENGYYQVGGSKLSFKALLTSHCNKENFKTSHIFTQSGFDSVWHCRWRAT